MMITSRRAASALVCFNVLLALLISLGTRAAGPTDIRVRRSMAAPEPDGELQLHWVRQWPALIPAWPEQPKLQFDIAYEPVPISSKLVAVASARTDSVTALDTQTGAVVWRFFANGPVRFAPVVWQERVYFVSDDGCLYCLDGESGQLHWKFRGGPADRLVLGNERLISTWPARGAPVVADGIVYFAAGIWPFMGVFLHALDARSGDVVWTNDGDGSIFIEQPHYADSFAGVAPQGRLAVAGDRLLVPGGRSVPACYDRTTGKQLYFHLARNGRHGGHDVQAAGKLFRSGTGIFALENGDGLGQVEAPALLTERIVYHAKLGEIQAFEARSFLPDPKATRYYWSTSSGTLLARCPLPAMKITALSIGSNRLFAAAPGAVFGIDLKPDGLPLGPSWYSAVEGTPLSLAASDGRLFVATREGRIYCFGPGKVLPKKYALPIATPPPADEWTASAGEILHRSGVREGWCISWGGGSGRLIGELARQSKLRIVAIEPDADRAHELRAQLADEGICTDRVAVHTAPWDRIELAPYCANLMVAETLPPGALQDEHFIRKVFGSLRPHGGAAWLPVPRDQHATFNDQVGKLGLANARLQSWSSPERAWVEWSRPGALPGASNWTHEHADAANTRVSRDQRVKAPLGLLWFGGPSHEGILPRHGHGPQPQVIDGRLIIEGPDLLRAIDIYTGRLLWETKLSGVGKEFDETWHQPGANASGSNYVSHSDGIYVAHGSKCLRLDPATGQIMRTFPLPPALAGSVWSAINVADDFLLAGVNAPAGGFRERGSSTASSKHVVVIHRHTGRVLWTATAQHGFRNNTLCMGGGRLYAIDRPTSYHAWGSNDPAPAKPRLIAFDLKSGKELWSSAQDIFGTWLSYSAKHDVLVEAGRVARDTLYDEADGMRAYRADRGHVLWYEPRYVGPAMIQGDIILKDKSACQLLTGAPLLRSNPLTGQLFEWTWTRDYGCNTPLASEHLLMFRSGAAGYFDLGNDGGTGNIGGFRSGCTNNLIVAGGVITAPEYTRDCTCAYQNQSSLGLVHMPQAEMWTYYGSQSVTGPVRRVGINLGAPGNRRAASGTLWLEHPRAGGPSYELPVTIAPSNPAWFRRHSSWIKGDDQAGWITSSGARGLTSVIVTLVPPPLYAQVVPPVAEPERSYKVRLFFVEPDGLGPGERRFDVFLQGRRVLTELDISKEAGGPARTLVQEFRGIRAVRELTISLTPGHGSKTGEPVLCGIEILADGW